LLLIPNLSLFTFVTVAKTMILSWTMNQLETVSNNLHASQELSPITNVIVTTMRESGYIQYEDDDLEKVLLATQIGAAGDLEVYLSFPVATGQIKFTPLYFPRHKNAHKFFERNWSLIKPLLCLSRSHQENRSFSKKYPILCCIFHSLFSAFWFDTFKTRILQFG
jgi:hypothetical protein